MRTLKELLPKKRLIARQEIDEKTIFHIAKRVVTEEYGVRGGENIIPVLYKEKKLFLAPRSSLWASEIVLQRTHLCDRINAILGAGVIEDIKVTRQQ